MHTKSRATSNKQNVQPHVVTYKYMYDKYISYLFYIIQAISVYYITPSFDYNIMILQHI